MEFPPEETEMFEEDDSQMLIEIESIIKEEPAMDEYETEPKTNFKIKVENIKHESELETAGNGIYSTRRNPKKSYNMAEIELSEIDEEEREFKAKKKVKCDLCNSRKKLPKSLQKVSSKWQRNRM
jgi:hypothetical protein